MLSRLRQRLGATPSPRQVGPALSIVLIVYDMPEQAARTIHSLSAGYQVGVDEADYEVLVVENASANNLSTETVEKLPANMSYHLRDETQPTPVYAINEGLRRARGHNVCVMIDGARLLTPGIVRTVLLGHALSERAVVTVPGYHLGSELQQNAVEQGYGVESERELMSAIGWPADGYRLFDIACFSGSCAGGFYQPHSESNCISLPRAMWDALGGYDVRFDMRGGGVVNLDMYKRACEFPGALHVFLHGEGTFHQFHGGVTTGGEEAAVRDAFIGEIMAQYEAIHGRPYESPVTSPVYLGEVPPQALRHLQVSAQTRMRNLGLDVAGESA